MGSLCGYCVQQPSHTLLKSPNSLWPLSESLPTWGEISVAIFLKFSHRGRPLSYGFNHSRWSSIVSFAPFLPPSCSSLLQLHHGAATRGCLANACLPACPAEFSFFCQPRGLEALATSNNSPIQDRAAGGGRARIAPNKTACSYQDPRSQGGRSLHVFSRLQQQAFPMAAAAHGG